MLNLVNVILAFAACILLIPVLIFCVECIASNGYKRPTRLLDTPRPQITILIPAHNEEGSIDVTLKSIVSQVARGDRVVVVADNCSDATAIIARRFGAEVLERFDDKKRSKGYALEFGFKYLDQSPPEILILIDADCEVTPGAIDALTASVIRKNAPIQALYLMGWKGTVEPSQQLMQFAWRIKNWIRPLGLARMGLWCPLFGTGMAFPWPTVRNVSLDHKNLVEDMQLGVDLALAGHAPQFCPEAVVTSQFPEDKKAIQTQRTRWEQGHMTTIFQQGLRIIRRAIWIRDSRLLVYALDLCVPPLTLLALFMFSGLTVSAAAGFAGLSWWPAQIFSFASIVFFITFLWVWYYRGRDCLTMKSLMMIPVLVLLKIPSYLSFLFRPQREWVRTKRGTDNKTNNRFRS